MTNLPKQVKEFLDKKTIAVFGVSRNKNQPANVIYRKLKQAGFDVFGINPNAENVESEKCYPDIGSLPEKPEAAVIVTHPDVSANVVRQCIDSGIDQIWMHRSFGKGSVSEEAVEACKKDGVNCIVGGCPMMYCEPVDFGHKCMKWILKLRNRVPSE
ncbi:MAG: CoA-binding protein [Acidobacteriota bacterium]|nr:CoA-binding protein [Acidobacteriota bacterium]MDH3528713.1 CoA-binding protein [Acidobacteriota bacterium]